MSGLKGPVNAAQPFRGHFVENRITLIKDGTLEPRHLNKHLDYTKWHGDVYDRQVSIADPQEMAVTSDGKTLYAVAFGSQKIVRFDTDELEEDSFLVNPADQVLLSAGGPSGIVLDEERNQLYVFTRFNKTVLPSLIWNTS